MTNTQVRVFADGPALARFAAGLLTQAVRAAVEQRGRFLISLSGGGTPGALYRLLGEQPYSDWLPWERMYFFWGDERCVPPDDPQSSYNLAEQTFLAPSGVPQGNIFRVLGELNPPAAAEDYAARLKMMAEPGLDWPRFDFVLLGLGADGHTASLFPGSPLTNGQAALPVTAKYQDRPANRVSLTPDVFNTAREVVFLVAGPEKAAALSATLAPEGDLLLLPARRIHPSNGRLWFLVDEPAAANLPGNIPGVEIRREA